MSAAKLQTEIDEFRVPAGDGPCTVWPKEDMFRLLGFVQAETASRLVVACSALCHGFCSSVALMRQCEAEPGKHEQELQAHQALASLELYISKASTHTSEVEGVGTPEAPLTWNGAWDQLRSLEADLHTEMRYVYGMDWELKPGKLVSKKGTWVKRTTQFSWELSETHKLYIPQGVAMPVLQTGQVADQMELKRHEWGPQHLRVWLKPAIVHMLEARRGTWFVYWPHWEDNGNAIVALADTWLKRTTQMSGELAPFELVYVPRGMSVRLTKPAGPVDEQWETSRHEHVHKHRKVVLVAAPSTVKQDKYDVLIGQNDKQQ